MMIFSCIGLGLSLYVVGWSLWCGPRIDSSAAVTWMKIGLAASAVSGFAAWSIWG